MSGMLLQHRNGKAIVPRQDGKKLPPKQIVYQFTQPIDKELGDWLKSKGVAEVRVGKL